MNKRTTYFRHWYLVVSKEEHVFFFEHLIGLIQVVVGDLKLLNTKDLAQILELVFVRDVALFGLLKLAVVLLSERGALVVPELPGGVECVGFGGHAGVGSC